MPVGSARREYVENLYQPKITILYEYFMKIGFNCKLTVEKYWEAVKECLIC